MLIFRVLLKILLFPVIELLTIASLLTKASIEIGGRLGGIIINIFAILGIINLLGSDLPTAAISGVVILLVLLALFFAANLQLFLDSLRDTLKRI